MKEIIVTNEDCIDILHRMTGYDINVIKRYLKEFKIKDVGILTMSYVYKKDTFIKLHNIEKSMKLEKLIKKCKNIN